MKKFWILALTLVLTASVFTGCRNGNNTTTTGRTEPSATNAATQATQATTHATTEATTNATTPSTHQTTPDHITDATGDSSVDATDGTGMEGRSRRMIPGMR